MSERYTFDMSRLKGRMVEKYGTIKRTAEASGLRREQISLALSGKRQLTPTEIVRLCQSLDIPDNEVHDYFFQT